MKDILARNPKLDDVIRRAANRLGENHGMVRDNHGATIDNQGNSSRYVGSGGQHPSQLNNPKPNKTSGWYRTLNETDDMELEEGMVCETCGKVHEGDCGGIHGEWEEATGASSSGSFEGPLFSGPMREMDDEEMDMDVELAESRILKTIIREEVSKKVSKQQLKESLKNRITKNILYENRGLLTEEKTCQEKAQDGFEDCDNSHPSGSGSAFDSCVQGVFSSYSACKKASGGSISMDDGMQKGGKRALGTDSCNPPVPGCPGWRDRRSNLHEKAFYNTGEFKYEKPTKLPGEIKSMPGMKQTDSTLKKSKSTNNEYLKQFDKKIKDYLDFEGNSHPEFPHQNNSKTDYKSPMYRNTGEDQEFIDDFRGMGLEDANGVDMLDRVDDYLSGSKETGNAQTDKDGKALGNVVTNKTGEKILKKVKRKKAKIDKQKSKMTNLRGMTPDVQTTTTLKESTEMRRMKKLISYKDSTQ
mgnify:FL=1